MKQSKLIPFRADSRGMKNDKRFPAPATSAASEPPGASGRLIVSVGKQRIAFDIACRATVLSATPARIVVLPKRGEEAPNDGDKK